MELHKDSEEMNKDWKEIGFALSQKYWGQALMPEAVKEVLNYGFKEEKIDNYGRGVLAWFLYYC